MKTNFLHFSKNRLFFSVTMTVLLVLCLQGIIWGQTTGDYRSTATGNWTTLATWQYFNGTSWVTPSGTSPQGYPGQFAGTNNVLIQSGHVATIGTAGITTQPITSLTIASTGQLYLTGTSSQVTFTINTSIIDIQSGGSIYFFNKVKLVLSANSVLTLVVGQGWYAGDCSANQEIWIGTVKFAACQGAPGNIFTFAQLIAAGGTLNAIPTSNSPLCQGNTINLTGNYSGAIGTAPTYSWAVTPPGGTATTYPNQNVNISSAVVGTYTAQLTVTTVLSGTTYTNSETIYVIVNPLPTVNAGGAVTAICQSGTTGALGGSFGGGATSAVWSDGGAGGSFTNNGGGTPNTATYTASSTSTSPVTLTLTTSGGSCGTTFASKQVTVNPLPTVNAGGVVTAICQGGTTGALGGSFGGGATSAVWSDGGAGGSFANNGGGTPGTATYTASSTSTSPVTLTLTTSGGLCGTTFASKQITVNPLPTPGITGQNLVSTNETGVVYTTQSGMTSYSWAVTGGSITAGGGSTDNTVTVSWGSAGTGHVKVNYINSNGCTAAAQTDYPVSILVKESAANASWNLSGTWYPSGVPTSTQDIIVNDAVIVDNTPLAVCNNMTINTGGVVQIDAGKSLTVIGTLVNNVGITGLLIKANSSGQMGSLIQNTANVPVTVEEYLSSQRWHLVSPPISDATINVYYDIYLKEYNEVDNTWTTLVLPTTIDMIETQGYYAWIDNNWPPQSSTVYYKGLLNTGDFSLTGFGYNPSTNPTYYGFRLVGNPYPCSLDWNTSASWNRSNMSGWMVIKDNTTYKGWNPYLPGNESWNGMTSGIIPSTQGFWVRATGTGASMTIPASQRLHNSQPFYKNTVVNNYPTVKLNVENDGVSDETVVIFHPDGHSGFDGLYDLGKFSNGEGTPDIYTVVEGNEYAVNIMPENYVDEVIPVYFSTGTGGNYLITATNIVNFSDGIHVYLQDLKTGTVTILEENTMYEFDYSPLDELHHFNLHFKNSYFGVEEGTPANGILVYASDDVIYINLPKSQPTEVAIYDMTGRKMIRKKITNQTLAQIKIDAETGYYLVKVQTGEQFVTQKVFIR